MQFTLHYDGPLPSKGSAAVKSEIREAIAPQIRELWSLPPLNTFAEDYLQFRKRDGDLTALGHRHGCTYAAIVSEGLGLVAELDILLMRAGPPGKIVRRGGDIDNRLKTLLDALSAPQQANQVTEAMRQTSEERPLFVLLEDDGLITRINAETVRLLAPIDSDRTVATIRVRTRVERAMGGNFGL